MSILRLANGQQFEIQQPNEREGILEDRNRPITEFVFSGTPVQLDAIQEAIIKPENIETMTVVYHGSNAELSADQLEGVANRDFTGYTVVGPLTRERVTVEKGTLTQPPVYGWQLKVELGQRQYGE